MTRGRVTRFGLQIPSFTYPGISDDKLFEKIAEIATTAERSGFDSVWVMDHYYQIPTVGAPEEPMFEAYALLSALAARTSTVKLGAMVTGVTYRNPAFLAKTVTGLDVISSGRAILGIGAAWNVQEHEGYGWDFPSDGERLSRLEEALPTDRLREACCRLRVEPPPRLACVRRDLVDADLRELLPLIRAADE